MTDGNGQKRTNKKRRITQIMDAMYRLDAIYPDLRENDPAFASLIAIIWLILADKLVHPLETKLVFRLYEPFVKLRRDDIRFICNRIEKEQMSAAHLDWLTNFLGTSLTEERKKGFVVKMWAVSYSDNNLHASEVKAIRTVSKLFGFSENEMEGFRDKGKSLAGL